jgi:hypothetical protein
MKRGLMSLALAVALIAAPGASADPSGKVARFWERKPHYEFVIHRCGPRLCVVGWTRRYPASTMTAITACRVREGRVRCRMRSAESSTMSSSEDSGATPPEQR